MHTTVQTLQERLDEVMAAMQRLADGNLDEKSRARFDGLELEAKRLNSDIERLTKLDYYQTESRRPVNRPPTPALVTGDYGHASTRIGSPSSGSGVSYRSLFGETTDRGGFDSWSDFIKSVETGEIRSLQAGIPSGAGFVVPTAFAEEIIGPALENTVALSRARVFPVQRAGSIRVPGWDVSSHASTLFGGVSAAWVSEAGTISETDHKTRSVSLTPRKLVASTSITRELEQDSFEGFAAILQQSLADAVSFFADDAILFGSGVGQPLGVFESDCLVTVDKETDQEADTINGANVSKMWSRLLPQSASRAVWLCSASALPQLYQMSVVAGAAGFGVFQPAGGFSGAQYASLFGRPLIVTEKLKAVGDLGDILVGDFSMYGVALAQEVRVDRSEHVHWSTDRAAYRAILRMDGQPLLASALTPRRGSETLSAFVTLAERA